MRFDIRELTMRRMWDAVERRVHDLPHRLAWRRRGEDFVENLNRVESYRAKHSGETCVVMASGPSLTGMDLEPLRNVVTFGMNRVYLMFDQWSFRPTYYGCFNELVLEQFATDIDSLEMPKFVNWDRRHLFTQRGGPTMFTRLRLGLRDRFTGEVTKPISSGGTVTFCCLQLAYFMGFQQVILIGLDHNFVEKGTPNKTEVRVTGRDESHCHPEYFPKGVKWQLPDLLRSERAYMLARRAFERRGGQVIDATVGGKCDVFSKRIWPDVLTDQALSGP